MKSVRSVLFEIPDPRGKQGLQHPLEALLGLMLLSILSGRKGMRAAFRLGRRLRRSQLTRLGFRRYRKSPCHATLTETLRIIDPDAMARALACTGLTEANVDADIFNLWLEQLLIPKLPPKAVIVMDRATFHRRSDTKTLIKASGHTPEYLPAYSPDLELELDDIEHKWAQAKGPGKEDPRGLWIGQMRERRHPNVVAVAIANKNARVAWALFSSGEVYRPSRSVTAA